MGIIWLITATIILMQTGLYAAKNNPLVEPLEKKPIISCDKEWYAFEDSCYKGFREKLNFQEAEDMCVKQGGHLVAIVSHDVQEFIVVQIIIQLNLAAFIGLREDADGKFLWTNGSELSFTAWDKNEPSKKTYDGKEEHCVQMIFSGINNLGKWHDVICDLKLPFICQKPKALQGGNAEEERSFCSWSREGFSFRNTKYHFIHHHKSWEEAEKYCVENYDGNLASITDSSVQKFLHYTWVRCKAEDKLWIGIRIKPKEVQMWSSGWYLGFTYWGQKTVQPTTKVSCGLTRKGDGQWDSASCSEEHPFVCEKSSVVAPARLSPTDRESTCPRESTDWKDLGGDYCYIFEAQKRVSWYEANFLCMKKGGTLAIIHSKAEELVLKQFITNEQTPFSIGLFRHNVNNKNYPFQWIDHSSLNYINWGTGEPSNLNEQCAEVQPYWDMQWNDIFCSTVGGYICSAKKVSQKESEEAKQKNSSSPCECLPTPAIIGVVLCVLLVIILIGVVLYNVKPWKKFQQEESSTKRKSSIGSENPRFRMGEIVLSDQIYENLGY